MSSSSKSAAEAIGKFVTEIDSSIILIKFKQIVDLISGSINVAKEKLNVIDAIGDAADFIPGIHEEYKQDLQRVIFESYEEEVQQGVSLLDEVEIVITKLQTISETFSQRLFEAFRTQNVLVVSNRELTACHEDCRRILIFLKLKSNILRHYLNTPYKDQRSSVASALSNLMPYEETALELINGSATNGKVIGVSCKNIEELLVEIGKSFKASGFKRLFTTNGGEIFETELLRDDESVYVSKGEDFIVPGDFQRHSDWVKLNVGGRILYTSRTTLLIREPESMLAKMFSTSSNFKPGVIDSDGAILIDRDPAYFEPILNYLRTGNLILNPGINPRGVLEEAQFFGILHCIDILEEMLIPQDAEAPLTRREVVNVLMGTANTSVLRFQGVNLNGADLSHLDLRNINFKFAKLRFAKLSFANLSFCNFERADMTGVEMNSATLSGVRMTNAIMEGANCTNCNFQDPKNSQHANMEGVNLRNAQLEDSDLTGANLRVANLKNANLKATILRGAILAGADLENADFTGSDLHEANLRGANLKNAALELMINPLHMSQAIR